MLIKSLVIKKDYLTTVNEHATLEEALKVLESSGYRCVPILDDSGKIFRGNIYKMHIYRHKSQGGDMSLPVTYLMYLVFCGKSWLCSECTGHSFLLQYQTWQQTVV